MRPTGKASVSNLGRVLDAIMVDVNPATGRRWTLTDIGQVAGLGSGHMSRIRSGESMTSRERAERMASAFPGHHVLRAWEFDVYPEAAARIEALETELRAAREGGRGGDQLGEQRVVREDSLKRRFGEARALEIERALDEALAVLRPEAAASLLTDTLHNMVRAFELGREGKASSVQGWTPNNNITSAVG